MMDKVEAVTPLICSICNQPILPEPIGGWSRGYNAEPINSGCCCAECDSTVVMQARIARMRRGLASY
jgi:hypothetical protein